MKLRRRTLLKVVLFLLAGAIINVAVAWGLGIMTDPAFAINNAQGPTQASIDWWRKHAPSGFPNTPEAMSVSERIGKSDVSLWYPRDPRSASFVASRMKFGWPLLALESAAWSDTSTTLFHAAIQPKGTIQILALKPVPSGFAINTIFYAAVLWVLFAVPGRVRRWRRIKRGQCASCGYQIGASPICTECGKPIPARPVIPS